MYLPPHSCSHQESLLPDKVVLGLLIKRVDPVIGPSKKVFPKPRALIGPMVSLCQSAWYKKPKGSHWANTKKALLQICRLNSLNGKS